MIEDGKPTETEVTPKGAVEIQDEQLDNASGGASDYLLQIDGVKGESKILGGSSVKLGDGSVKPGDGSVRGVKFNPGGRL